MSQNVRTQIQREKMWKTVRRRLRMDDGTKDCCWTLLLNFHVFGTPVAFEEHIQSAFMVFHGVASYLKFKLTNSKLNKFNALTE